MTVSHAKEILDARRPDGSDDDDLRFAEQEFDDSVRAAIGKIRVPSDLKERLFGLARSGE